MSPYQAQQPKHKMDVYFNNWSKAKQDRLYKPLSVGASVKIMIKKRLKPKPLIQHALRKYIELLATMVMTTLLMKITEERYIRDLS